MQYQELFYPLLVPSSCLHILWSSIYKIRVKQLVILDCFFGFFVVCFFFQSNPQLDRKLLHILKLGRSSEAEVPVGHGPLTDILHRAGGCCSGRRCSEHVNGSPQWGHTLARHLRCEGMTFCGHSPKGLAGAQKLFTCAFYFVAFSLLKLNW